jgi:hypothetical protein
MRARGNVAVEVNAEIADVVGRWRYEVRPDPDRHRQELVKLSRRGTPEQFGLVRVELKTIGVHTAGDVIGARADKRCCGTRHPDSDTHNNETA